MKTIANCSRALPWLTTVLLGIAVAGCGGGGGAPILGGERLAGLVPAVTSVSPAANVTGVPINTKILTAAFTKAMDPATLSTASFTLRCPAAAPVAASAVTYQASANLATLTLAAPDLPPSTVCVATVSADVKDTFGIAIANNFTWSFTTGAVADTTAPLVAGSLHANGAVNAPTNTLVGVTFSESMDPATVTNANFNVAQGATAVAGAVSYAGVNAVFTPASALAPSTLYTVTVKGGAGGVADLAGNPLASDHVTSWTTAASADSTAPVVASTNPLDLAIGVCTNKTINATFSEPMNPLSISSGTFTLAVTAGASVNGTVSYDALTRIASFDPMADLTGTPASSYTATVKGGVNGVKDVAGNALAADKVVGFTVSAGTCVAAPVLGAAAAFGGFGGNATLTSDGLNTVINGDIGVNAASTKITGLRDTGGNVYTITTSNNGQVNGLIYTLTAPPGSVAGAAVTQARADALVAFNAVSPASLPGGIDVASLAQCPSCGGAGQGPGQLAGRTLPPGVYLSTSGTYGIGITVPTAGNLTLDAGGDADAVWVFQTAAGTGTLTVGVTGPATPAVPIQVLLVNGARAKNVFWYIPAGAEIGTGSTMVGTMLSDAAITLSTTGGSPPTAVLTTLNGRAIALTAGVTMTNTVVNVPAP